MSTSSYKPGEPPPPPKFSSVKPGEPSSVPKDCSDKTGDAPPAPKFPKREPGEPPPPPKGFIHKPGGPPPPPKFPSYTLGNPPPPPKGCSAAKLKANQENAGKSTGPRTARGKANVCLNAVKHGFLAKEVVISSKFAGEDPKDFERLIRQLFQYWEPVGKMEELLVEDVAVHYWRARRAICCELGEVGQARDVDTRSLWKHEMEHPALQSWHKGLQAAKSALISGGELDTGGKILLSAMFDCEEEDFAPGSERRAALQEDALQEIKEQIEQCCTESRHLMTEKAMRIRDRHCIPPTDALVRLMRYQAQNDRKLQRALSQLQQLQRERKQQERDEKK